MRLPAVAIAAAFACGIALGFPAAPLHAESILFLSACFVASLALILIGIALTKIGHLIPAAIVALFLWALLGFLGARVAEQTRSPLNVRTLVEQGHLSLQTPLKWHGLLRDEPTKLPWGHGLEIELTGVEYEGGLLVVKGGLRASFASRPNELRLPELHSGDEITILTEAKPPQVFRDDGAFDRRSYLAEQGIDLVATLRAPELIERVAARPFSAGSILPRARRKLREQIDGLCEGSPQVASVLRAMLLGDRTFVDRDEATDFQKTGAYHVLVVAGLHVGAIAAVLFWAGRKLRLARTWTLLFTLALLFGYVAIVEQRPPVLRAAIMATLVVLGRFFFRRLELLNSIAVTALALLIARPLALRDSSFQLTFVAIACIAGLAVPWLNRSVRPYARALRGWRDVTRDAAHEPHAAQFRIDLRLLGKWICTHMPAPTGKVVSTTLVAGLSLTFCVWELLVVTVALQIGMLPLMARDFHRVALAAPIVNLGAVPMIGVLVPLGFVTLAMSLIFPTAGHFLGTPLAWATTLLMRLIHWFAHFPRWSYRIPGPPFWLIASFFVVGILLAAEMRLKHSRQRFLAWSFLLAWIAFALTIAIFPFQPKWCMGKLEVTVLDVGQGDSIFVVSPGGKTLLLDGGGAFGGFLGQEQHFGIDPGEEAVSPYLWSRGFRKLDVVALTHAHQDHLGGLNAILENFRVGKLCIGREVNSLALQHLEDIARERKIPVEHELRGGSFDWDGVRGTFLWPGVELEEVAPTAKNDDSLVLRLKIGNINILLPGDAEKQAEQEILKENDGEALQSDILKVGYHGSKNSTTLEFLAAVHPRIGIISVGETNPYGHPSPELLERLEGAGVRILRTDRDGAVRVLTDGQRLEISCFAGCPVAAATAASAQTEIPDRKQHSKN